MLFSVFLPGWSQAQGTAQPQREASELPSPTHSGAVGSVKPCLTTVPIPGALSPALQATTPPSLPSEDLRYLATPPSHALPLRRCGQRPGPPQKAAFVPTGVLGWV